jgi:hypothetical protein
MPGHNHGLSILDPSIYEGLRRHGFPKDRAAAISNAHANRMKKKPGRKQQPWYSPSQVYRGLPIRRPGEEEEE